MDRKFKYCKRKRDKIINSRGTTKRSNTELPIVEISDYVLTELHKYRQHQGEEQAGVLMASIVGDNKIRINCASPSIVASQSFMGCVRDAAAANKYVQDQYERSEHTRMYIGEWHTHPEKKPTPSCIDVESLRSIYRKGSMPYIILVIVGQEDDYIAILYDNCLETIHPLVL